MGKFGSTCYEWSDEEITQSVGKEGEETVEKEWVEGDGGESWGRDGID